MKYVVFIILCVGYFRSFGQPVNYSSDTTAIQVLLSKANEVSDTVPEDALRYLRKSEAASRKIRYEYGMVQSWTLLGQVLNLQGRFDSSIYYYRKAIRLSTEKKWEKEFSVASLGAGDAFMRLRQGDSARYYLNRSLVSAELLKDVNLQAGVYNDIGNVFLNENKTEDALTNFIKSANLYESVSNKNGLTKAWTNIGNVEFKIGNYDKAIDYTRRSMAIAKTESNFLNVAYCHKLLAINYRKQKKHQVALLEYDSAFTIYITIGALREAAEISSNTGNIHFDLKEFDKAIRYYQKSLKISRQINYQYTITYGYSGLAYTYYEKKNYPLALIYCDSLMLTARVTDIYLLMDVYELKSIIYQDQKKFEPALENHILFSNLKDSLTNAENRERIATAEGKYQNDLKQNEIDKLKREQELKDARLDRQRLIQIGGIFVITFIIVVAAVLINWNRKANRSKRELEIERVRNTIARDLHDDIGSTLSSINILSQVASRNEVGASQQYFQRIGEQSSRMMENMSDIVWSINPNNDSLEQVIIKMKEFTAEILEPLNILYKFQVEEPLTSIRLNAASRKNIFLIFKEAINNAAKYSKASHVIISIAAKNKKLTFKIEDDGIGFDLSQVKDGNGRKNMGYRANDLRGRIHHTTALNAGTKIILEIPLA